MNKFTEEQKEILFEEKFPAIGLSKEERDTYLNIIRNCKEILDSEHKIDGEGNCEIIQLYLEKINDTIRFNGDLSIGSKTHEVRCIDGYIYTEKGSILVDIHIVRVCVDTLFSEYSTVDEFKIVNNRLVRESYYNYDMKKTRIKINDEGIERKIK